MRWIAWGSAAAPKAQRCLAADLGQELLLALALAQPAGIVLARLRLAAQQVQRSGGAVGGGVSGNAVQCLHQVLAQRHVLARGRVHVHRVQPEAAGLEAVVGVDEAASDCTKPESAAARSMVNGVSNTRISMVPYSGLGRMSQ